MTDPQILTIQQLRQARERLIAHPHTLSYLHTLTIDVDGVPVTFERPAPGAPWLVTNPRLDLVAQDYAQVGTRHFDDRLHITPGLPYNPDAVTITDLRYVEQALNGLAFGDADLDATQGYSPRYVHIRKRFQSAAHDDARFSLCFAAYPAGKGWRWEVNRQLVADFHPASIVRLTPEATLGAKVVAVAEALNYQRLLEKLDGSADEPQQVHVGPFVFGKLLREYYRASMLTGYDTRQIEQNGRFRWNHWPVEIIRTEPGHHGVTAPDAITLNGVPFREDLVPTTDWMEAKARGLHGFPQPEPAQV